jgi:DNA invertase Pin-like site-specific DNA recombinase
MSHVNSRNANEILTVDRILTVMRIHGEKHFQKCKRLLQEAYAMMKLQSQDLREKVSKAIKDGKSREEVARMFHISVSTVKRYLRQYREQSYILLKLISGHPLKKRTSFQTGRFFGPPVRMERRTTLRNI